MSELNLPPFEDTSTTENLDNSTQETVDTQQTQAATPAEPELYEVKINGKTFKVPLDELRNGYQRQQDYTTKAMRLAEERRQLESIQKEHATYRQEREQIRQFLQDRAAVAEYLKQLQGYDSPDQPVTAAQMQALVERQLAMREQAMQQHFAAMSQELEVKQTAAQYSQQIDATISATLEQFPELKSVRRIEKILKEEVADRQPATLQEAISLFQVVAKEQAEGLRSFAAEEKKRAEVAKTKLSRGIEPPGGTGVTKASPAFKLGSEELRKAFEESLKGN